MTPDPRFEVRAGEIDMVPMALATLDLVARGDAQLGFPAVHLEGHTVLSCGRLAGLAGGSGRVLRQDSKALVLCAGDRDLATLLAYLAVLRLGHADRLSGPLVAILGDDGTRRPLFLVHPDNGQAGSYCRLAHALGEEFAASVVQAPGLFCDAEPRRTASAMPTAYVGTVRAVCPTGPYLLGGCAIGMAIGYEMAARLDDMRLVAAIGIGQPEPPDTGTESWLDEPSRQPGAWPAGYATCSADPR